MAEVDVNNLANKGFDVVGLVILLLGAGFVAANGIVPIVAALVAPFA